MNILFLTSHAYFPQRTGGSESSTHNLCQLLKEKGHKTAVISSLNHNDLIWLSNRLRSKLFSQLAPKDKFGGYNVYRTWDLKGGLKEVINDFNPDCIITQAGENIPIIKDLCEQKIKTFVYLRDVSFDHHGGEYFNHPYLKFIANSEFTASRFYEKYNLPSKVIPPIIPPKNYQTSIHPEKVLFVCPNKEKGIDIALQLATKNKDIPFVFLESWPLNKEQLTLLRKQLENLDNVEFLRSQKDMKTVYAKTKVAIIPSQCEEAWGRIASECQVNGIPVIANSIGGLPESVGTGGILISHTEFNIDDWHQALRLLWDNEEAFAQYQVLALQHSKRSSIKPAHLIDELEEYIL